MPGPSWHGGSPSGTESTPYLHGALHIEPDVERRAIESGAIQAVGFLYVGERALTNVNCGWVGKRFERPRRRHPTRVRTPLLPSRR